MCTKNVTNKTNKNFIITNIILSMSKIFTCDDVLEALRKYSINDESTVKKAIARLRDNDYLEEQGSYYRVLDNTESRRWGIC